MNLIPCPDCNKMISPTAKSCPNCGRVIQAGDVNRGLQQRRENNKGCWIAIVIIVGIIVICGVISLSGNNEAVYQDGKWYIRDK